MGNGGVGLSNTMNCQCSWHDSFLVYWPAEGNLPQIPKQAGRWKLTEGEWGNGKFSRNLWQCTRAVSLCPRYSLYSRVGWLVGSFSFCYFAGRVCFEEIGMRVQMIHGS